MASEEIAEMTRENDTAAAAAAAVRRLALQNFLST
jgi:hypothetical protein